jgi:hypothetical protein
MPESLKKLPIATQSFSDLIEGDFLYVDKTDLIYNLIDQEAVFLSRPSGFGMTLLLSTIEELFLGHKQLFQGLKISSTDYSFNKYPVIYFDLAIPSNTTEILEQGLTHLITDISINEGFNIKNVISGIDLELLLRYLYKKYSQKVVVLIDNFDDPVRSHIDNTELANDNNKLLHSCFATLKRCHKYLQFILVTGITRYALMSFSAGLNHLYDISFNPKYSEICGFTPTEMDYYLGNRYSTLLNSLKSDGKMAAESTVDDLCRLLLDWYGGYSWDGKSRLLNPISILQTFYNNNIDSYWYNTARSRSFISNMFKQAPLLLTENNLKNICPTYFRNVDIDELNIPALLFNTGYLTLDTIEYIEYNKHKVETYNLKAPNFELQGKYYTLGVEALSRYPIQEPSDRRLQLFQAIAMCDGSRLSDIVAALYQELPAKRHPEKDDTGSFYYSILWAYCSGLFPLTQAEVFDSDGNIRLLLVIKDDTHVPIGFKYSRDMGQEKVDELLDHLANTALQSCLSRGCPGHNRLQRNDFITVGLGVFGRGQVRAVFG